MKPIERRRTERFNLRIGLSVSLLNSGAREQSTETLNISAGYLRRRHALCDEFVPTPKHRSAAPLQDARGNQPRACNRLGLYRSRGPHEACHFSQRFTECGGAV